jgi:hypothetical protein
MQYIIWCAVHTYSTGIAPPTREAAVVVSIAAVVGGSVSAGLHDCDLGFHQPLGQMLERGTLELHSITVS